MKRCARCGKEKPKKEFYKHKKNSDGLQSYCKKCGLEYRRERKRKKKIEELKKRKGITSNYESDEDRKCLICEEIKSKEDFAVSEYNSKGGQRCRECMSKKAKDNSIKRIKRGEL